MSHKKDGEKVRAEGMKEVVSGVSEVWAVDHMGDIQATVGNG